MLPFAGESTAPAPASRSFSFIPVLSSIGRSIGGLNFRRRGVGRARSPAASGAHCAQRVDWGLGRMWTRRRLRHPAAEAQSHRTASRHGGTCRGLLLHDHTCAHKHRVDAESLADLGHLTHRLAGQRRDGDTFTVQ